MDPILEHGRLEQQFHAITPAVDFFSLRFVREQSEEICVRQNVVQPLSHSIERGAMLTVIDKGAMGYASTSDLSLEGLQRALEVARNWAMKSGRRALTNFSAIDMPHPVAGYESPVKNPWQAMVLTEKLELLTTLGCRLKVSDAIGSQGW